MANAGQKSIFVLNGPNLNLLGQRELDVYGSKTLEDVKTECEAFGVQNGAVIDFRQSNSEGELVGWIHDANSGASGVVLNAGAYTHTSIALHDAIKGIDTPVLELHISNIHAREEFRHQSRTASACIGQICGLGTAGYTLALQAMLTHLNQ
jgi:3-dehydroquinate dehydratase-2